MKSIPILCDEAADTGCHDCVGRASAQCHTIHGLPCAEPELVGPSELIQQLMAELDRELSAQAEGCIPPLDFVHALRLTDGEAELRLGVDPRHGGAALLDAAFQALRRLLPDTDIYVSPVV